MDIELLTVKEVAEILKVSKSTVYGLAAQKVLRAIRIGRGRGTLRISRNELERFVATKCGSVKSKQSEVDCEWDLQFIEINDTT